MNKSVLALVTICSAIMTLRISLPAQSEMTGITIGPSLILNGNNGLTFGIDSKIGVSDNLSIRPSIYFPSNGNIYGAAVTYDFNNISHDNKTQFTPFLGAGVNFVNRTTTGIRIGSVVPIVGADGTPIFFPGATPTSVSRSATIFSLNGGVDYSVSDSIDLKVGVSLPLNDKNELLGTIFTIGAGYKF